MAEQTNTRNPSRNQIEATMNKLKPEDYGLLRRLVGLNGTATSTQLGFASYTEYVARQRCKRLGLVVFSKVENKWSITGAGLMVARAALGIDGGAK